MDFSESTKIVSGRIQKIEPEHASKIVGYLLLHECGDQDMIRLAFCPDNVINAVTSKVKNILGLSSSINHQLTNLGLVPDVAIECNPHGEHYHSQAYSSPNKIEFVHQPEPVSHDYGLEDQLMQFLNLDDHLDSGSLLESEFYNNNYHVEPASHEQGTPRASRRSHGLTEFPPKVCHYFRKGFCKHGNNCRYLHNNPMTIEGFSQLLGIRCNLSGIDNDDHKLFRLGSLEKLEMELTELLRSRNGIPVSIASLPMLYYEKYGRTLQAEGYLTESQRHGKIGYSLTKLLVRLENSICIIDRPHGQHSVILAEDAPKYINYASDQCEHGNGGIVPGSRQIYLTFPAESTFTEIDVSDYFNSYGPVEDVRIPCQQKRMFGFVTFVYTETVRKILATGNPHYVCGARVLVKPYREKSRLLDRKQPEKIQRPVHYYSQSFDRESAFQSLPRACDHRKVMRKQSTKDYMEACEPQKTCLSSFLPRENVASASLYKHWYF